jgi:hypothetical protein
MIITEKMIRELQRRVDISYEEAEKFLRRAGGNIDIAESYVIKKANSLGNRLFREFERIINATLVYRIRVYKGEDQLLNVPILIFLIIIFLIGVDKSLLLSVVFVILALIADCNLQIIKIEGKHDFRFYNTVKKDDIDKEKASKNKESDDLNNMDIDNKEMNNKEMNNKEMNIKDIPNKENSDKKDGMEASTVNDMGMNETSTIENSLSGDDTETKVGSSISDEFRDNENQHKNHRLEGAMTEEIEKTIDDELKSDYLDERDEEDDDYYEVTIDK